MRIAVVTLDEDRTVRFARCGIRREPARRRLSNGYVATRERCTRLRERVPLEKQRHCSPVEPPFLGTAREPPSPNSSRAVPDDPEPIEGASATEVAVVTSQLLVQGTPLIGHSVVKVETTPRRDAFKHALQATLGCSFSHHPLRSEALAPVDGEPEEVEGLRSQQRSRALGATAPRSTAYSRTRRRTTFTS